MQMIYYHSLFALIYVCSFCIATPAVSADPDAGFAIARAECAGCHAIGKEGASPLPAAPPFQNLSQKWPVEYLQEALAEGMSVGHGPMPEFIFEPKEISDLVAYLFTIQQTVK
jgi:mono/diheme cytochrome c family protein